MKLKGNHKKLWDEIGHILWEEWDPIGVNKYNGPDDEYNSYIPSIYTLLVNYQSASIIARRLDEHVRVNMGLKPNTEHSLAIVAKLISLRDKLLE